MSMVLASDPLSVRDQLLQDLQRGTSDLPALSRGVSEALRLARCPTVDIEVVARAAESDPPLAARLLSIANSALYGRGARIYSLRGALVRLGLQATRDVLYQAAYASMLVRVPRYQRFVEESFHHGVTAAQLTRLLARHRGEDEDLGFLAGLLHDVGRARCWKLLSNRIEVTGHEGDAVAAVNELHARAGAELAERWHLPDEVVDVCRLHHQRDAGLYPDLVSAADIIGHAVEGREGIDAVRAALDRVSIPSYRAERILADATLVLNPLG